MKNEWNNQQLSVKNGIKKDYERKANEKHKKQQNDIKMNQKDESEKKN